jgi:hypothetical protein
LIPNLSSRVALVVTISYVALIAVLLIAAWHFAEPEARAFDLLFIGFPWVLATFPFRNHGHGLLLYCFAIILNVASVYFLVFALVRVFSSRE